MVVVVVVVMNDVFVSEGNFGDFSKAFKRCLRSTQDRSNSQDELNRYTRCTDTHHSFIHFANTCTNTNTHTLRCKPRLLQTQPTSSLADNPEKPAAAPAADGDEKQSFTTEQGEAVSIPPLSLVFAAVCLSALLVAACCLCFCFIHNRHVTSENQTQPAKNILNRNQITQIEVSNWKAIATTFDEMNLKDDLLRGIYAYGFEKPSAIQQRGILPILAGHDTIAQAQSGTGKTATFSISVLQKVREGMDDLGG